MKSLILGLLFTVFAAVASDCPQHYQGGANPTPQGNSELCYSETPPLINGRLPVPGALFKAVYIPQTKSVTVYVSDNGFLGTYHQISVDQLTALIGFNVFPALDPAAKD